MSGSRRRRRSPKGRPKKTESRSGRVRGYGHDGSGVVATPSGVVFVPGALREEVVDINVTPSKRVSRGQLQIIRKVSVERVSSPCPYCNRFNEQPDGTLTPFDGVSCGGCPWMGLSLESQRVEKTRKVREALGYNGDIEMISTPDAGLGYRRRARMAFSKGRMGYRGRRNHTIVDVAECAILHPTIAAAWRHVRSLGASLAGEGEIRIGRSGAGAAVSIRTESMQPQEVYRGVESLVGTEILFAELRVAGAIASWGEAGELVEGLDGEGLLGSPDGFTQANDAINLELVKRTVAWAEPSGKRLLELYSGNGNFTVELCRAGASVTAVEHSAESVLACRENLATRDLHATIRQSGSAEGIQRGEHFDVVVLDPPRTGAKDVIPKLLEMLPTSIVYVSCDPATLARDVREFTAAGYQLSEVCVFDMFPHTAHVETLVRLKR